MKRFAVYSDAKSAEQAAALFAATGDRLPVLLLDATNANSYPGAGRSWMNVVGMDGEAQHVANFETAPGFSEGAIIFDGTTRADIDITDKSIGFHYRDSWTIEMLLNPAEHQATYAGLFGDHDCLGYTGMVMQQNADTTNEYLFGTGGADGAWHPAPDDARPLITLPAGEWSHLVLSSSRELGTTTFYVNGVAVGSQGFDWEVAECPDGTRLEATRRRRLAVLASV